MISLTITEQKICQLLAQASVTHPAKPILRIAGGWVRDKLLGEQSEDLDIAIDTCKGESFAHHFKNFITDTDISMGNIATIQVNPEKSKHLETATAKILGLSIDFVHLRTERYNEDSRNPLVDFGTPLEDAMRRDITINALFYNIHTKEVEDFTEKGLKDLKNGIIRTPLHPLQTFIDDPLRVLRVIRFATRFNYTIDPLINKFAGCEDVKIAFTKKITRERIGLEVDKMIQGQNPLRAIQIIYQFGFMPLILDISSEVESMDNFNYELAVKTASTLAATLKEGTMKEFNSSLKEIYNISLADIRFMYLASLAVPYKNSFTKIKTRSVPNSKFAIMFSLKLSQHDGDICSSLIENSDIVSEMIKNHAMKALDRKSLGLFIRSLSMKSLNEKWPLALYFSMIMEFNGNIDMKILEKYENFMRDVKRLDLQYAHDLKPLLDGKTIAKAFGIRPGPSIGSYLQKVIEWQLENPRGDATECIQWLESIKESAF